MPRTKNVPRLCEGGAAREQQRAAAALAPAPTPAQNNDAPAAAGGAGASGGSLDEDEETLAQRRDRLGLAPAPAPAPAPARVPAPGPRAARVLINIEDSTSGEDTDGEGEEEERSGREGGAAHVKQEGDPGQAAVAAAAPADGVSPPAEEQGSRRGRDDLASDDDAPDAPAPKRRLHRAAPFGQSGRHGVNELTGRGISTSTPWLKWRA